MTPVGQHVVFLETKHYTCFIAPSIVLDMGVAKMQLLTDKDAQQAPSLECLKTQCKDKSESRML